MLPGGCLAVFKNTKSNKGLLQFVNTLSVCYLCLSCGTFLGYTSSAIPSMEADPTFPDLTIDDTSWIGSLGPLGALCGALLSTVPIRYLGVRRTALFSACPAFLSSWVLIIVSGSVQTILLARFIGGLGTGLITSCAPLYVMGIAAPGNRGRLGILPQLLMLIGILVSYIIGNFMDWKSHGIVCCAITSIAGFLLVFALDTPQWLLANGAKEKALEVLHRLNEKTVAQAEYDRLLNQSNLPSTKWRSAVCTSATLKGVGIALGVMTFQQISGVNGITFYAVTIFRQTSSSWGSHLPTIVLAGVQVLASIISTQIIDRAGRKVLLVASSVITGLASTGMGFYFYWGSAQAALSWIPLVTLVVFAFGFAIGFGPVAWILVSELLPDRVRQVLNPLIMAYTWLCVFGVTKSFPLLIPPIRISGVFWLYGGSSFLGLLFVIFGVPETKGKSAEELQQLFLSKSRNNETENCSTEGV